MSEGFRNIKVVGFTTVFPPEIPSVCRNCGEAVHPEGVCRRCALRLIDVALASASEEFPRVVDDPLDASAEEVPELPRRYDHYEICRTPEGQALELGRGAMGITYKATDLRLGCLVALKIINPDYLVGKNRRDRFLREARTAARLKHPNIANVHHLGLDEEEQCFYAMEYIEGETLAAHVRRVGPLPWAVALEITRQATRALRLAHQHQFVHRDIKPTNLMLVDGGEGAGDGMLVKLIDFGLVKAIASEETSADAFLSSYFAGTPGYASPEQLRGGETDARSDLFSLGVCLWFMLAGEPPPVDSTFADPQPEIADAAFPLDRTSGKLPPAVSALLRRMVSADPISRPQTAAELLAQVEACLESPRKQVAEMHRRLQTAACVGVLGVAAVAAWLVKSGPMNRNASEHPPGMVAPSSADTEARVLYAQGKEHATKLTREDNLRAIELYSEVVARSPKFAEAHAALASAYLQNFCRYNGPANRLDAAFASAQRAIALDPGAPAGFTVLGGIRTIQGMHWEALGEYHHALELNPRHLPAMRGFAQLWSTVGQPQRGLPWARAAAGIDPAQTNSWNAAADASVDLCADEQAEGFYRRCLEVNPAWMSAHCGLLHLHLLQGNLAQARRDAATAESIDPGLLLPLTLKAQVALFSGEYGEAEAFYRRLVAMKRDGSVHYYSSITYLSALGFLRRQAGDYSESDALLAEAEELHRKDSEGPQAIYDLAAIRAIQGKGEEALSLLQQAIASGWMDYRATRLDPRFNALRDKVAFRTMLDKLSFHVEAMRQESETLCSKPLRIEDYPVLPQGK